MTTHTNSLARRSFLSALAAGTLTISLRPRALAAAAKEKPLAELAFVVVSDTHLGYKDRPDAEALWRKTAAEIAALKPRFLLHLGDIVDGGREAEYPKYLAARKQIGESVYEIPGNHDPRELFEKYIRKPVETAVDCDWLKVLLLGNAHPDSHAGFLTQYQLAWTAEQLAAAEKEDRYVILAMHVPAHTNKHPDRGWYVGPQDGQKELYDLLDANSGRVLALFHGHFHNGIRGWNDRRPLHEIVFPSALYNQDRQLAAQKAPGYNLPEFRPGYTLMTLRDGELKLEYRVTGTMEKAERTCRLEARG